MAEAQQFVWGGPEAAGVPALRSRLQEALAWGGALDAATQAKPTLEALEPLLAWQPPPIAHPGAPPHTSSPELPPQNDVGHLVSRPPFNSLAAPCRHQHPVKDTMFPTASGWSNQSSHPVLQLWNGCGRRRSRRAAGWSGQIRQPPALRSCGCWRRWPLRLVRATSVLQPLHACVTT